MDFETFIDELTDYFRNTLPTYIERINLEKTDIVLPLPKKYENEYSDLLANSENIVFYVTPFDYGFEYMTNESQKMTAIIKLIVTFKGYPKLYNIAQRYMTAIYNMQRENYSFNGIVDDSIIDGLHYEDNLGQNVKSIEVNLKIEKAV